MIRRPPRSTHCISSAASDVYKRQGKRGRVANSIRTLVRAAAVKDGVDVEVDFSD